MDLAHLEALLTLLRKHGVTSYKDQFRDFELHIAPPEFARLTCDAPGYDAKIVSVAPEEAHSEEKPITMEQALFWSSSAPGAGSKP